MKNTKTKTPFTITIPKSGPPLPIGTPGTAGKIGSTSREDALAMAEMEKSIFASSKEGLLYLADVSDNMIFIENVMPASIPDLYGKAFDLDPNCRITYLPYPEPHKKEKKISFEEFMSMVGSKPWGDKLLKFNDLEDGMKVIARWGRAGATSTDWGVSTECTVRTQIHTGSKPTKDGTNPGEPLLFGLESAAGEPEYTFGEYAKRDYQGKGLFLKEDYYLEIYDFMTEEEQTATIASSNVALAKKKGLPVKTEEETAMLTSILSTMASIGVSGVEIGGVTIPTKTEDEPKKKEEKPFTLNDLADGMKVQARIGVIGASEIEWSEWSECVLDVGTKGGYIASLKVPISDETFDQTHWDTSVNAFVCGEKLLHIKDLVSPKSLTPPEKPVSSGPSLGGGMMSLIGGGSKRKSAGSSPWGLKAVGGSGREVAKKDPPPPIEKIAWEEYQRELRGE